MLSRTKRALLRLHRRLSSVRISTKMTALYASLLFVLLMFTMSCMGMGIYYAIYHQAGHEIDLSEQQVMRKLEDGADFSEALRSDDGFVLPGVVLRVTDITGRVVFENDTRFPSVEEVAEHTRDWTPFWSEPGLSIADLGNWIIYHKEVTIMHGGSLYTLHFLRTITAERTFLQHVQQFLLLTLCGGFIIALAMGYLVSCRILLPIRTMTATARKIEIERMDRRIEVPEAKDELTELAVTFNHMLDRLQEGITQQQRFVSDASHELRTPVTVILGYSDLLARWGQSDAGVLREGIASIRSEAENMQQLIEKLLFLARADQKRQVLHREPLEFSELLGDVMKKMKLVTKDHTVALLRNDEGMVYADQVMLRQMMRVFLENSTKYTPKGGRITAESERRGDHLRVTFADTGIGIAPKDQKKVFERFYRVDTSRTKAEGVSGTGLGLSIASWIAEQHGIEISMDSDLGKGTRIHLDIPLVKG